MADGLQQQLERQAKREQIKRDLCNWGAWQRENNLKPMNQLTGVRNVSLSAILMKYAPKQEKTGSCAGSRKTVGLIYPADS